MPAKTVKDLIAFNNSVDDEFKVGVKFENHGTDFYLVGFCSLKTGRLIEDQTDELREKYYGDFNFSKFEKGGPISRYEEPSHKPLMPWGRVSCKENIDKANYNCHNAWFVSMSEVAKGYGPMLYDCLLVILGQSGNGLIGDRSLVSPAAARVWAEYLESRPDVTYKKLDFEPFQTSDKSDDCYASHEKNTKWNSWVKEPEKQKEESPEEFEKTKEKYGKMRKAMTFAYFDNGIKTLDELKQANLFVNAVNENYLQNTTKQLKKLYESFIRELKA
jgi:hypothetical protein